MIQFIKNNPIWVIIIFSIFIGSAFGLGLFIRDWPILVFDKKASITDILNTFFTVILALLIPLYIKYFIERGNKVNEIVVNELHRYREQLEYINERFLAINHSGNISSENKSELVVLCEILDGKYETVNLVFEEKCKNNSVQLRQKLLTNHIRYWKLLTGIEVNISSVTFIQPTAFKKGIECYNSISDLLVRINLEVTER